MRRWLVALPVLWLLGCPGSPPDGGSGGGDTAGGEVPASAEELPWPDTPITELARRETMAALEAMDDPPRPVAFLVRMDVAYARGDEEVRWLRVGVVLAESGLHVFEARPIDVTDDEWGELLDDQPLALLARGLAELPLLGAADCERLGGEAVCEPLLTLTAESVDPATLRSGASPTRVAPGDQALLGRSAQDGALVVDLTISDAPRATDIGGNQAENADP